MDKNLKIKFLNFFPIIVTIAITLFVISKVQSNGWSSIVYILGMLIMTLIRVPFQDRVKNNKINKSRQDKIENILLFFVTLTMYILPVIQLSFNLFDFANYTLPKSSYYLGSVLMVFGLYLFYRSHADLGKNWSVSLEIREKHTLITKGVYKLIRHPMYAAIWLIVLAQPLLLHNFISGVLILFAFSAMYLSRRKTEEKMMFEQFGKEYLNYCNKTGRVIPFCIKELKESDFK